MPGLVSQIKEAYRKRKKKQRRTPTGMRRREYISWRTDEHLKSRIKGALRKVGK